MKRFVSILSVFMIGLMLGLPIAADSVDAATAEPSASAVNEADLSNADAVLLYCIETDTILREKNADKAMYPAAAVKLMTALVAYEMITDQTTQITLTSEMLSGVGGNRYGFAVGNTVMPEDLLKTLLLRKSNDAATALATLAAGSEEAFVAAMNEKAAKLEMDHTVFTNATGIHDSQMTTTATDLLALSLAFYSETQLQNWAGEDSLRCESMGVNIYNNNFFLSRYYNATGTSYLYSAVDGMMNGGTDESGEVLITSAVYKGLHYIVILLGGKTVEEMPTCYTTTRELLEKDTQNFTYTKVLLDADVVCELPVLLGSGADYAAVFAKETLEYYLPKALDRSKLEKKVELTVKSLEAPVQEGNKVGTIAVYYNGKLLGKTDLVVRSNITRSVADYRISQVTDFLGSTRFLAIALSVIGLFVLYFIANAIYRGQVKKKYRDSLP